MSDVTDDVALGELPYPVNGDNGGLPAGLPMPRDPDLLATSTAAAGHAGSRVTATRSRCPTAGSWWPSRRRWRPASPALHYFDRDLVLYRAPDGAAHVLDAYCPHLGAHLAVGGRVEDGCLRCPFHGWSSTGVGHCVEIPYGDVTRIPPKAHAHAYPTLERDHMIWAWYHAQDGEPFYEVPVVPEFHDEAWSPIVVRDFEIRVSAQDMAENNVDFSHFRYVHGTDAIPEDDFFTDGTYKRAVAGDGGFVREGYGLGLGVLRSSDYVTFLSSTTPIDAGNVHVRWVFTAPGRTARTRRSHAADRSAPGCRRTSRSGRTRCTGTHRSSRGPRSSSSSTAAGHSSSTPDPIQRRRGAGGIHR